MADLSINEAFRALGAKLANQMWAYSAIADDGSLVISCWSHHLKLSDGVLSYSDRLSRWNSNEAGNNLFIQHLTQARDQTLPVRLIVVTAQRPELVERDADATTIEKSFHIKEGVVGKVVVFDGDNIVVEFRRA